MAGLLEAAKDCLASQAPEEALRLAKEAIAEARATGDARRAVEAVCIASSAHCVLGRAVEAEQVVQKELDNCRASGQKDGEARLLWALAGLKLALSDAKEALRLAREGEALVKAGVRDWKLQVQLLIAQANAHLAGNIPGTGLSRKDAPAEEAAIHCAGQALALSRSRGDEEGQGEALHVICLVYLVNGLEKASKVAADAGEKAFASLQSSNEAAALLHKLGNKEAEATALLFGIAPARLAAGNYLEALGAVTRARAIFLDLGHRRGRLASLNFLAMCHLPSRNTLAILDAVEEELTRLRAEGDVSGQLAALTTLADAYIETKMYGDALSAARRSLQLLKDVDLTETEVRQLLCTSQLEELLGSHDAALRSAQTALKLSIGLDRSLAVEARRAVSSLQARLNRPEQAPNRRETLDALSELGRMARKRDGAGFKAVMSRLEELSGYTEKDIKDAVAAEDDPDRDGLVEFLRKQRTPDAVAISGGRSSVLLKGLDYCLLYLTFRVTGLQYGPRFRRCRGYGVHGRDEEQPHAVSFLKLLSSEQEWCKRQEYQPPMLDSMQHSMQAFHQVLEEQPA
eukprot:TRINITY_DN17277_c0_g1_i1.p1 TRINITY_DN17277_c0_g1~~TRINITY_DN17277_c0_g1_i1.p1  ORF type:complete len:587 (-),score=147.17 TRINITY_DN17277_c0_g1_i1:163-1881(-)